MANRLTGKTVAHLTQFKIKFSSEPRSRQSHFLFAVQFVNYPTAEVVQKVYDCDTRFDAKIFNDEFFPLKNISAHTFNRFFVALMSGGPV